MIIINLKNIEDTILKKAELRKLLPDLSHLFDQWHLSCRVPSLRSMGMKAKLDLLNLMKDEHVQILQDHYQDSVVLDRLNYNIVKNVSFPLDLDRLGGLLSDVEGFPNFVVSRNESTVYISLWR